MKSTLISLGGDVKVWELARDDDHKTLCCVVHFKMVNFMSCQFHLNERKIKRRQEDSDGEHEVQRQVSMGCYNVIHKYRYIYTNMQIQIHRHAYISSRVVRSKR